ncbi:MAG: hypothetical protein SGJ17_06305 [Hyphomicrobiales bacterium]|nr:hypothetical protein [Hyphomicrobiales bacterium]
MGVLLEAGLRRDPCRAETLPVGETGGSKGKGGRNGRAKPETVVPREGQRPLALCGGYTHNNLADHLPKR